MLPLFTGHKMRAVYFYNCYNTFICYTPELLGICHLQKLTPSELQHQDAIQLLYIESETTCIQCYHISYIVQLIYTGYQVTGTSQHKVLSWEQLSLHSL